MMRTFALLLTLAAAGCGSSDPCADNPASCHDAAGQDASQGSCAGQCQPPPTDTGPRVLIWTGPEGASPPACPSVANAFGTNGYLDAPPSKLTCAQCSCSPTGNLCSPPSMMSANASTCPGTGAGAAFDAPQPWDGTCSAMDPAASASSVTVDPPSLITAGQCSPGTSGGTVDFSGGKTVTLRCNGLGTDPNASDVPGSCTNLDDICVYPDVPGFSVCAFSPGDISCPPGWPAKHLIYEEGDQCYCSCGDPTGELCSATVTAYSDKGCSAAVGSVTVTSEQPTGCFDVPAGSALGNKAAKVSYTPGTCPAILTKLRPSTLCCLE